MAFDATAVDNLFQLIGKYIKHINILDTDLTDLNTQQTSIRTVLDSESYIDDYALVPSLFDGYKASMTSIITALITESKKPLTDRTNILSELRIPTFDFQGVLDGLHDYFTANSEHVLESIVTIDTADVDLDAIDISAAGSVADADGPKVFITRTLDGLNPPSNTVSANSRYINLESHLSMPATLYFENLNNSAAGSESLAIYPNEPANPAYTWDNEEPELGTSLINVHGSSNVPSNWDFTGWSADDPDNWTMGGGVAGTDWEDEGSVGTGALKINTAAVTAEQLLSGLTLKQMYLIAVYWASRGTVAETDTNTLRISLQDTGASTVFKTFDTVLTSHATNYDYAYNFYALPTTVDTSDLFIQLKLQAQSTTSANDFILIKKVMVVPVTYYNGLGFVFWNGGSGLGGSPGVDKVSEFDWGEVAIANPDTGLFQTFLRKAYGYQLPTTPAATPPSITETWASA